MSYEGAKVVQQSVGGELVLLDVDIPVLEGFQVMSVLRSHPETQDVPVILLAGA